MGVAFGLPPFFSMNEISVLGYCWKDHLEAGYLKWHGPILEMLGFDMTVTHLALKVNDWIVHPFSGNDIKWVKARVSDRCFKKPCREVYVGHTHKTLDEIQFESRTHPTNISTCYLWFYTCGLYTNKQDCVSWTKKMLEFTSGVPFFTCQTPNNMLKELENHGYGISPE